MPESNPTPRKITLEELLRLKRLERPGPEYWVRFDRELNEKVWRALTQPAPRPDWLAALWGRRMRWLAAGTASIVAVFVSWFGRVATPIAAVHQPVAVQVAADVAPLAPTPIPSEPVHVAEVLPAPQKPDLVPEEAPSQYAVSTLDASVNPANAKIPAKVVFTAERPNGERYASDALYPATNTPWRESAY
jgi:hypothetical protein